MLIWLKGTNGGMVGFIFFSRAVDACSRLSHVDSCRSHWPLGAEWHPAGCRSSRPRGSAGGRARRGIPPSAEQETVPPSPNKNSSEGFKHEGAPGFFGQNCFRLGCLLLGYNWTSGTPWFCQEVLKRLIIKGPLKKTGLSKVTFKQGAVPELSIRVL